MGESILEILTQFSHSEWRVTLIVCAASLVAVWWPLTKGALLCWRARAATRIPKEQSEQQDATCVASLMHEISAETASLSAGGESAIFTRDAAKQLVVEDYESSFAHPISMYANILPPIGFIGTTSGLAILLLSMRVSNEILQVGALALALSSTIFALMGYAILEGFKIYLYGRLAKSIDAGLGGEFA